MGLNFLRLHFYIPYLLILFVCLIATFFPPNWFSAFSRKKYSFSNWLPLATETQRPKNQTLFKANPNKNHVKQKTKIRQKKFRPRITFSSILSIIFECVCVLRKTKTPYITNNTHTYCTLRARAKLEI